MTLLVMIDLEDIAFYHLYPKYLGDLPNEFAICNSILVKHVVSDLFFYQFYSVSIVFLCK